MSERDIDSEMITFAAEETRDERQLRGSFKVLIADDEEEVHRISKLIFSNFVFMNRSLAFIDTYSGKDTIKVLSEEPDIAVLFLDVVMEEDNSGLQVVEYLRNTLENHMTRIILRTGQPGEAPEERVIRDFDINDYRLKTELTSRRLMTTMYTALRNYQDLQRIDMHKKGLEKIISASATLFRKQSLDDFLLSILEELANFQYGSESLVFMSAGERNVSGFISQKEGNESRIVAATGKYAAFSGKRLEAVSDLVYLNRYINSPSSDSGDFIIKLEKGILVKSHTPNLTRNFIYIEGDPGYFDVELINLFLNNFSIALDNFIMTSLVQDTQEKIVYALGETVESHFEETGNHIQRVSHMMRNFAMKLHFSVQESEMLRLASTMHDVGKIAIPDSILMKKGKLTEREFEIVKSHPSHGFRILSSSDMPVLKQAAEIALNHHEKYDGSGYPSGKAARDIPLSGRMMAILDVYDALTHKRCYKDAISSDEALRIMKDDMPGHFDPELFSLFINNFDQIVI